MGGIAICFPMSDLLMGSLSGVKTMKRYMGYLRSSTKQSGRKAKDFDGIAISAEKHRGKKKDRESVERGAKKRIGRTKENYRPRAVAAEKMRTMVMTEAQAIGHKESAKKILGRTKENDPSVERMSKKVKGRTKENHEGTARRAEKIKGKFMGEKSPSWIDGRSFLPYTKEFNVHKKKCIKDRDNYICQGCGIEECIYRLTNKSGRGLDIHHINYDKMECSEGNLISVCGKCNLMANSNREFWQRFYTDKLLIKTSGVIIYG